MPRNFSDANIKIMSTVYLLSSLENSAEAKVSTNKTIHVIVAVLCILKK